MKVYGLWHGGYSYSPPCVDNDLEEFGVLYLAKIYFKERERDGGFYRQPFFFVNRDGVEYCYTPTVDESSTMWIYFYDPREAFDPYPDRRLTFGPRGGVRVERC